MIKIKLISTMSYMKILTLAEQARDLGEEFIVLLDGEQMIDWGGFVEIKIPRDAWGWLWMAHQLVGQ